MRRLPIREAARVLLLPFAHGRQKASAFVMKITREAAVGHCTFPVPEAALSVVPRAVARLLLLDRAVV